MGSNAGRIQERTSSRPGSACSTARSEPSSPLGIPASSTWQAQVRHWSERLLDPGDLGGSRDSQDRLHGRFATRRTNGGFKTPKPADVVREQFVQADAWCSRPSDLRNIARKDHSLDEALDPFRFPEDVLERRDRVTCRGHGRSLANGRQGPASACSRWRPCWQRRPCGQGRRRGRTRGP